MEDKLLTGALIFLALCCDLGLFAKRIIAPAANLLTDSLHIPGGIGTSFSLMFLVKSPNCLFTLYVYNNLQGIL